MTESKKHKDADFVPVAVDEDLIVELNFVPDWARKPPGASQQAVFSNKGRGRRDGKKDRYSGFDEKKRRNVRRPSAYDKRGRSAGYTGREGRPKGAVERRAPAENVELPAVNVQFLPMRHGLASVVGKIKAENKAFPMAAMAAVFLSNPDFCSVKIEPRKGDSDLSLYLCKVCKIPATKKELLIEHIMNEHMDEYFDKEDVVEDAPTGQFVCVAKCGLSGILLGPPNHHSYESKIREVYKSRYGSMSFPAYRKRIETIHDPDLIERWKEEIRNKTVYRLKGKEGEGMTLAAATEYLCEHIAPSLIKKMHRIVVPAEIARKVDDPGLAQVLRLAWSREHRHPYSLLLALRGAFKSMHLFVLKTGKGSGFVVSTRPRAIDPEHAVDHIRDVLVHLQQHPGCTRGELVEALRPGRDKDDPEIAELLSPLGWLIDRGHIIEFFNGALSVPLKT
ncbi:MAG: hypothetical protein KAH23_01975 [Kiritimatiellae bacterium]|nr:hypothetical protein [Kiritimatiellia bacterium]